MKKLIILLIALFIFSASAFAESYRLTDGAGIVRLSDSANIPADPANNDYAKFLKWKAAGGVADPYVEPEPTIQDQINALEAQLTQRRMREAVLDKGGQGKQWLKDIDDQIDALRLQLP